MVEKASCQDRFANRIDRGIAGAYGWVGLKVGPRPRWTIAACCVLTALCGIGFLRWTTENRPEKLWVPQNTEAQDEKDQYDSFFGSTSRVNQIIVQASDNDNDNDNVLTKELLVTTMKMHIDIASRSSTVDDVEYILVDLCAKAGGSCANGSVEGVCQCLVTSVLSRWNFDLETIEADNDVLKTLNEFGSQADLEAVLGKPQFNETGSLLSAEAMVLTYFLKDRSEVKNGDEEDPINEAWEKDAFLKVSEAAHTEYPALSLDYYSERSFDDEFGGAIESDITLIQVSYAIAFLFVGATMGNLKCGTGSRWSMAFAALLLVGLATIAGFGLSSMFGLFFGPMQQILPFVLLGIGVDDAFVIVNAFNRERKVKRVDEDDESLTKRSGRAMARAGASILVTSTTDLVAFAISSTSALPALSSFCAYASIAIFFLWLFASTFFAAAVVLDERRQRENRRECLCWLTRKNEMAEESLEDVEDEGLGPRYFREYHAPVILGKVGKPLVLLFFAGLLGFGIYGATNLSVEDTGRKFIPAGSYVNDFIDASDEYFPDQGVRLYITFEKSSDIYAKRELLAGLKERVTDKSTSPPYIAEPVSAEVYRNVMDGMRTYLASEGTSAIGGAVLGDDNWPTTEADFVSTLANYSSISGPGSAYAQDVSFSEDMRSADAYQVKLGYVKLLKKSRGKMIADAEKQIDAMRSTRDMIESWNDLPEAFPYSEDFINIESFIVIRRELFLNVGLALVAVGVIVFFTVASLRTALLITANVSCCIIEILGMMWAMGIAIDSVSVINVVLAVGLSVDYSAHVGHCFMVKGGSDRSWRATEALADIGSAVLQGAMSTFLAVVVLLFSTSYVFETLSRQFCVTVVLGVLHGLVLLPVLLSLFGPKPFASAENPDESDAKTFGETEKGSMAKQKYKEEGYSDEDQEAVDA